MMFLCAWAASRHLRAHTEPAFSVTYKHACDMVLTLTWPRFGVGFDDLSDVVDAVIIMRPFFFSWFIFFASRDGRGTKNCCPRHGQLVLCRSSTIPLFQNQILNRPSSTGQKLHVHTSHRHKREGNKLAFWQNPCSGICARESAAVRVFGHEGNSQQAHPVFPVIDLRMKGKSFSA